MKRRLYYYGEDVLSKSFLILPKELVFTKSLANMSAKSKDFILCAQGAFDVVCKK